MPSPLVSGQFSTAQFPSTKHPEGVAAAIATAWQLDDVGLMGVSPPPLLGLHVEVLSKLNGNQTVNVTVATSAKVSAKNAVEMVELLLSSSCKSCFNLHSCGHGTCMNK